MNKLRGIYKYIQDFKSSYVTVQAYNGETAVIELSTAEAATASATAVHAAITALTTVINTGVTGVVDPPYPRNLTITCAKGGGSNMAGDVVITGTNVFGEVITDTIAEGADGTIQGTKAFKTVTNILVPVRVQANDAVSIGFGDKIGLPFYCYHIDQVIQSSLNYAIESTRATLVADDDEIEKNTLDLNSALNGTVVRIFLIVYGE